MTRALEREARKNARAGKSLPSAATTTTTTTGQPVEVYAQRRQIKYSPWKLNQVARQLRLLPIDDAIRQMEFSPKKVALDVRLVLKSARANAASQTPIADASNMHVAESWVGKGKYGRGIRRKGKGRGYTSDKPFSHYYVKLREGPPPSTKRDPSEAKIFHSKRQQDRALRRPQRVLNSLE